MSGLDTNYILCFCHGWFNVFLGFPFHVLIFFFFKDDFGNSVNSDSRVINVANIFGFNLNARQ